MVTVMVIMRSLYLPSPYRLLPGCGWPVPLTPRVVTPGTSGTEHVRRPVHGLTDQPNVTGVLWLSRISTLLAPSPGSQRFTVNVRFTYVLSILASQRSPLNLSVLAITDMADEPCICGQAAL